MPKFAMYCDVLLPALTANWCSWKVPPGVAMPTLTLDALSARRSQRVRSTYLRRAGGDASVARRGVGETVGGACARDHALVRVARAAAPEELVVGERLAREAAHE